MIQINSNILFVVVILISYVYSDFGNYDEYGGPSTAGYDKIEEEVHMDSVPTGYLPDSVYRELAWYGILQIQPLYFSTKHKVAARWIWQNTLGRPHVILENGPQATESDDKGSHQVLLEESVKWARDQRSAVDVMMENIRSGGNGLTVRTVISSSKKTVYIIQNGKYYECEGSEPDTEAFRAQPNMHERKCTGEKEPKLVSLDICMEAEFLDVEYSFADGWNFCMGDGERSTSYDEYGYLDCGQKKKVSYRHFLEECAIDGNVVITFEYFGDEPRKDLIHNTTICTTWDPCHFSYLYRIEIPSKTPEIPSTTVDPCDVTLCPECVEGNEHEFVPADEKPVSSINYADYLEWVEIATNEISKYRSRAIASGGHFREGGQIFIMRARYKNMTIPGKLLSNSAYIGYNGTEIRVEGNLQVAFIKHDKLEWVVPRSYFYDNAIPGGIGENGEILYICRAAIDGHVLPGYFTKKHYDACFITHHRQLEIKENFDILIAVDLPRSQQ